MQIYGRQRPPDPRWVPLQKGSHSTPPWGSALVYSCPPPQQARWGVIRRKSAYQPRGLKNGRPRLTKLIHRLHLWCVYLSYMVFADLPRNDKPNSGVIIIILQYGERWHTLSRG